MSQRLLVGIQRGIVRRVRGCAGMVPPAWHARALRCTSRSATAGGTVAAAAAPHGFRAGGVGEPRRRAPDRADCGRHARRGGLPRRAAPVAAVVCMCGRAGGLRLRHRGQCRATCSGGWRCQLGTLRAAQVTEEPAGRSAASMSQYSQQVAVQPADHGTTSRSRYSQKAAVQPVNHKTASMLLACVTCTVETCDM